MAMDQRVLTAALFAEKVVAAMATSNQFGVRPTLERAGYEVLGAGCFGAVVRIPGTEDVLKVCDQAGDGYPVYAQWAQNNPGPAIPEIYYAQRIDERLFVCAMPAYQPLTHDDEGRVERMRDQHELEDEPSSYLGKAVAKVVDALDHLARRDMHIGNFMYCPHRGEYIITDPYAQLSVGQQEAEAYVTGRRVVPQIKDQLGLALAAPDDPRPPRNPVVFKMDFADVEQRVSRLLKQGKLSAVPALTVAQLLWPAGLMDDLRAVQRRSHPNDLVFFK